MDEVLTFSRLMAWAERNPQLVGSLGTFAVATVALIAAIFAYLSAQVAANKAAEAAVKIKQSELEYNINKDKRDRLREMQAISAVLSSRLSHLIRTTSDCTSVFSSKSAFSVCIDVVHRQGYCTRELQLLDNDWKILSLLPVEVLVSAYAISRNYEGIKLTLNELKGQGKSTEPAFEPPGARSYLIECSTLLTRDANELIASLLSFAQSLEDGNKNETPK